MSLTAGPAGRARLMGRAPRAARLAQFNRDANGVRAARESAARWAGG
jgi:hypothetical protein